MKIREILKNIEIIEKWNYKNISVPSIHLDSREVKQNSLFIAIKGEKLNGNDFIDQAIKNKAKIIIFEGQYEPKNLNVIFIKVENSRKEAAIIAKNFYKNPSSKLKLIGVTGTNGKTTTANSLFEITRLLGYRSALLSTIENKINNKIFQTKNTTPDPIYINKFLNEAVKKKCKFAFMECSSHSIDQKRIYGLDFALGIFTNLTRDHLDYHKTFKKYALAKKEFFDNLSQKSLIVANKDDKHSAFITKDSQAKKYFFSLKNTTDFNVRILSQNLDGSIIEINKTKIYSKMIGKYNVYNLAGIYATCHLLGLSKEKVIKAIDKLSPPKGRLEFIKSKDNIYGIVDYAHTPDALSNVLKTLKELKDKKSKIITVFGCGGERDKTKRPIMGQISTRLSNITIITTDNPRSEKPAQIINEISKNIKTKNYFKIADRKEAIKKATLLAQNGDIILLAGKGHENYQILKDQTIYFDDKKELQNNFR
jgi:UDP-N-acetylmuramoyl-L-alanyl-D-glutamate--2,6-diaminopimelate ligase